jgi:hypothetical protein
MSTADIKNAIINFDEKVLGEDALRNLKEFIPTPEELQMIREYPGDKNDLADAEKFFLEISTVQGLGAKINGLLFKVQFSDKADAAKQEINILDKAIEACRKNNKFIQLLEVRRLSVWIIRGCGLFSALNRFFFFFFFFLADRSRAW